MQPGTRDGEEGPDPASGRGRQPEASSAGMERPGEPDPSTPSRLPGVWREHWFGHSQHLRLSAADEHLAMYLDADVDPGQSQWMRDFLGDVWRYCHQTYGPHFGPEPSLFVILHQGRYGGGHAVGHRDPSHDYRNVIDCGPGPWRSRQDVIDIPVHEIGHIVEGENNDVSGSPAFPIWRDSKWAEFFAFDVMTALSHRDTQRVRERWMRVTDGFPRSGCHWFRDWFHPLWDDAQGPDIMVRFFGLLAAHFPRQGPHRYARDLNWGEFLHFSSAAAGGDLRRRAADAFGTRRPWSGRPVVPGIWAEQFERAREDFPDLTY